MNLPIFRRAPMPTKPHGQVKVHDPMKTLRRVVEDRASIARFGDGEIKLILYTAMRFQEPDERLHLRMLEVLRCRTPGLLIGAPYQTDDELAALRRITTDEVVDRIFVHRARLNAIWDPTKEYFSAYISRPDAYRFSDYDDLFRLWRLLWAGRDVVVVENDVKSFSQPGVLTGHKSLERVTVPMRHAWNDYDRILADCLTYPKDRLFLLAAGPTATVLAHDLHVAGYQAVDVGHIWRWLKDNPDPIITI